MNTLKLKKFISIITSITIVSFSLFQLNIFPLKQIKAISPKMEKAVQWAINIANDPSHGYDIDKRSGEPDYDCSSLVAYALINAGLYDGYAFDTGAMQSILPKYNFVFHEGLDDLQRGDILWVHNKEHQHTEIYIGGSQTVGAHKNEFGGIRGGLAGDQSGDEISVTPYYNWCNYKGYFRYNENAPNDQNAPTISDVSIIQRSNSGYVVRCNVTDSESGVNRVEFPTWSLKKDLNGNEQDDITWVKGVQSGSSYAYEVKIADHNNELGAYRTHIYAFDYAGNCTSVAVPDVEIENIPPTISDVEIINAYLNGYVVRCNVNDNGSGIDRVVFPTWTLKEDATGNDQDDITWTTGVIDGSSVSYWVKTADHNNEVGVYRTHIYAYDKCGNVTSVAAPDVTLNGTAPTISNVEIINQSADGYVVRCNVNDNGSGIERVEFPTWTLKEDATGNDQDDITWTSGVIDGSSVSYWVKRSDHNDEYGVYRTHIYAYDKDGNCTSVAVPDVALEQTPPLISNVKVFDVSAYGYSVECEVSDLGSGIDRVQFPTWTSLNNQDDIQDDWQHNSMASGIIEDNKVTFKVNISDHNNEVGDYQTHIYAYDKCGNYTSIAAPIVNIKSSPPSITDIQVFGISTEGYGVKCTITDNGSGIERIAFPTWTLKEDESGNDQDDILWTNGTLNGSTATYWIKIAEHNDELGVYRTHIFAYDKYGSYTSIAVPDVTIENESPIITDVEVFDVSSTGYSVKCKVTDSGSGIDRVQFPTWTLSNDQDDIQSDWQNNSYASGTISDGIAIYKVNIADHNNEIGEYSTHIYAYDRCGNYISCAVPIVNIKENISTTEIKTNRIIGDANGDGDVTVADAVAILQYIGNKDKYNLSEQGKKNADVDGVAGITGTDALTIQKVDAGIIKLEDLPLNTNA